MGIRGFLSVIQTQSYPALNPGSCGPRRFDQEITMAVMTVDNGTYQWEKVAMIPEK